MRRLFVTMVVVSTVVGCEGQIDSKKAEDSITDELKEKDLAPKSVTCPAGVKLKQDEEFKCKVKFKDDQEAEVNVTQIDAKGRVKWKLASVVSVKAFEGRLDAQHKGSKFTCPGKVVLIKKDATITCKAKTGDEETDVEVNVGDDEGKSLTVTPKN